MSDELPTGTYFYEERVMDGNLVCRTSPRHAWSNVDHAILSHRYIDALSRLERLQEELAIALAENDRLCQRRTF